MKWYYAKKGNIEQRGCVDEAALREMARNGQIQPDDLLWDDTDNNTWIKASSIEGLIPQRKPVAIKKPALVQEPIAKVPANFGRKKKKKKNPVKIIIFIIGLIGIAVLVWKVDQMKKQEPENGKPPAGEAGDLKDTVD